MSVCIEGLQCHLNRLDRNKTNTYNVWTFYPATQKVEEKAKERLNAERFQTPLPLVWQVLTVSHARLPSPRPLWMRSIDPKDGEEMKGGEPTRRKSKHRSKWQNTDHPRDLDFAFSLFPSPSTTFAPQPEAMSGSFSSHLRWYRFCACWQGATRRGVQAARGVAFLFCLLIFTTGEET